MPSRLSPQWLCGNSCTWDLHFCEIWALCVSWITYDHFILLTTILYMYIYMYICIYLYIYIYSQQLFVVHWMGNSLTSNIFTWETQEILIQMVQRWQLEQGYHPTCFMVSNPILITILFWANIQPRLYPRLITSKTYHKAFIGNCLSLNKNL